MQVGTIDARPITGGASPQRAVAPSGRVSARGVRLLAVAALLSALPFTTARGDDIAPPSSGGCVPGPMTLARLQAAAPSGPGSPKTPADAAIEDGYGFVMLGTVGTRLWPDKNARLDSLMQAGDRADALCKIRTPDGTSWLVLRSAGGTLRYILTVGTTTVQAHDADLSRMHKIWTKEIGGSGTKPKATHVP